jgi:hypothetical protein
MITKLRMACLVGALACAAAGTAIAQDTAAAPSLLSKDEIKANKVRIEEQYDQAQTRCRRVQGHARELCNEQARGERDIQAAELRLRASPTPENDGKLRLAKAEAAYSRSLIQCKPLDGSARDVCRKDAKDVFNLARTEARLQGEVAAVSLRAENAVRERTAVADRQAEAEFAAAPARQRCEVLPGEGRENCLADVKRRYDK